MKVSNLFNEEDVRIDEIKLRKMRYKIYAAEREYYKTKNNTIQGMKNKLREIIINEYKKNIGG